MGGCVGENTNTGESVYFDDFNIIHTRNNNTLQVVQTTDYYPFGLAMAAQSYQKQSTLDNDYLYNGKELQDEHNLGWMDYGARMYMAEVGRFFTQDRFAEKYNDVSPYQYANNPILFIDVNGDSILIKNGKENDIIYYQGKLTWAGTGKQYDGKALRKNGSLKGFVGKTTRALNEIRRSGETGGAMISDLESGRSPVSIKSSVDGNSNIGLRVDFDPNSLNGGPDENGNTKRPAWLGLAHELAHSYDYIINGKTNQDKPWFQMSDGKQVYEGEKFASHIENIIRSESRMPLRTHYAIDGVKLRGRLLVPGTKVSQYFSSNPTKLPFPDQYKFRDRYVPYEY